MWKTELEKMLFSNDPDSINVQQALNLKYQYIPTSLYKYKSFDQKGYWMDILEKDLSVLSNPKDFNDPYDCAFNFAAEESGIKHFKENLDNIIIKLSPLHKFTLEEIDFLKKSENFFYDLALILQEDESFFEGKSPEESAKGIEKLLMDQFGHSGSIFEENVKNNLFIHCFSETNKSILMWSHYADYHRGFCIEYNFSELGFDHHLTRMIFPVIYKNTLFDITNYLNQSISGKEFNNLIMSCYDGIDNPLFDFKSLENIYDKKFNNMVFCYAAINKSTEWSYEKEWRFILPLGPHNDKKIPIMFPKPKAIYLGAKVDEKCKNKVLEIAEKRSIKVYAMHRKTSEFTLESNEIN
jgi:hypothetical protein